jgi:hypothetical protein
MVPREIREMKKLIDDTKKIASRDTTGWEPNSKMSVEIAKTQAIELLAKLVEEIDLSVARYVTVVALSGKPNEIQSYCAAAADESPVFILSALSYYNVLGEEIFKGMSGGRFDANQVAASLVAMKRLGQSMGLFEFNRPNFAALCNVHFNSGEQLAAAMYKELVASNGETLATLFYYSRAIEWVINVKGFLRTKAFIVTDASKLFLDTLARYFENRRAEEHEATLVISPKIAPRAVDEPKKKHSIK